MSLTSDLAEYHDVVSRAVVVLDKDVSELEGRYQAISSACKQLESRVKSLESAPADRDNSVPAVPQRLAVALSVIALLLSLASLLY